MKNELDKPKKTIQESLAEIVMVLKSLAKRLSVYVGFSYLVLLLLGLIAIFMLVTQSLQAQGSVPTNPKPNPDFSLNFDQTTIKRIGEPVVPKTQTGRANPFTE